VKITYIHTEHVPGGDVRRSHGVKVRCYLGRLRIPRWLADYLTAPTGTRWPL
jgi:hypothetical protein